MHLIETVRPERITRDAQSLAAVERAWRRERRREAKERHEHFVRAVLRIGQPENESLERLYKQVVYCHDSKAKTSLVAAEGRFRSNELLNRIKKATSDARFKYGKCAIPIRCAFIVQPEREPVSAVKTRSDSHLRVLNFPFTHTHPTSSDLH